MLEEEVDSAGPIACEGPTERAYLSAVMPGYPSVRETPRDYDSPRTVAHTPSFASARVKPAPRVASSQPRDLSPAAPSHGYSTSETPEAKVLRALAEAGYANIGIPDLARLLPPDSFQEELVVMADVRAYYHVAYKRIIDHIPLTIEHALHHALAEQLSQSLFKSLLTDVASGSNFSERMNELVSEDASIAQKRASLSTRKQRLSDIRRRLMTFGNST